MKTRVNKLSEAVQATTVRHVNKKEKKSLKFFYVHCRGWRSQTSMSAGGLEGAVSPPQFFGILDVLRVNLRHMVKII